MPTTRETVMIDIKLRNVKIEDADLAIHRVNNFMAFYGDRRGIRNGCAYGTTLKPVSFYVYRTDKTIICVGQYKET